MAKPGPKPARKALKVLTGMPAARIDRRAAPSADLPEPPAWLDHVAREEWDRIVPQLASGGLLMRADSSSLAIYCSAFSRRAAALEEVEVLGTMIGTGMGGWKANPAVAIVAQAEGLMSKILVEFGATPASRSRVGTPEPAEPADELAAFLKKKV